MKKTIIFCILILTLVLVVALSGGRKEEADEIAPVQEESKPVFDADPGVIIASPAGDMKIKFWTDENGQCLLFLPAFVKEEKVRLSFDEEKYSVLLDGREGKDGETLELSSLPEKIKLRSLSTGMADDTEYDLVCMRSADIPAVFINTASLEMGEIDADKEVSDKAEYFGINPDGSLDHSGVLEMIRARGNSSFQADKKSYRLKFSQVCGPFGMSADKSFILQANAYDNTRIRNPLAYTMADELGLPYTPQFMPVDLYLNNDYAGNYLFLESVKVSSGRVDIKGDDSFLLEVIQDEKRLDDRYFSFFSGQTFLQVNYPEKPDGKARRFCQGRVEELDRIIESLSPEESLDELSRIADVPSFADMFLFDFVTNEIDAGNYSTYLFIDGRDKKVYMGPVWDYDKAWGNEKKKNELIEFNAYSWRRPELLFDNLEYQALVKEKIPDLMDITDKMVAEGIDEMSERIRASVEMDVVRNGNKGGQSVNEESMDGDLTQLKDYLKGRMRLLYDVTEHGDEYCRVYVREKTGRLFWVKKGESLTTKELDFGRRLFGCDGFALEDGCALDEGFVINEDCVVLPK